MTETQNANRPGALIAMSGGVDSSVAAWLMQQKGYACTGITMRLTRNETLGQSGFHTCCSEKDIEDAAEVAYATTFSPGRGSMGWSMWSQATMPAWSRTRPPAAGC